MKNQRMNNEKRTALLKKMEEHASKMVRYWDDAAFCADNYEDSKKYLEWSIEAYGEAMGYYFAAQLFDDNKFSKDMYKLYFKE